MLVRLIAILLIFIAAGSGSGCLVSSSQSIKESGATVSPQTLQQIEPGKTTEGWLLATLGKPSSRVQVDGEDDLYLLRYSSTVTKTEATGVFLLFGGNKTHKTDKTHYFEISRGVVVRHWSDQ